MCAWGKVASASPALHADGGRSSKKKIKAQWPEEGRMGLYWRQIKGGETKKEIVKFGKRIGGGKKLPLSPSLGDVVLGGGGLSTSLWLGSTLYQLLQSGLRMQT